MWRQASAAGGEDLAMADLDVNRRKDRKRRMDGDENGSKTCCYVSDGGSYSGQRGRARRGKK